MFIVNENLNDAYFATPFDIEVTDEQIRYYQLTNIENDYFLKDYDVKKVSSQKLGNKDFWNNYCQKETLSSENIEPFDYAKDEETNEEKGFFISHRQVGIELDNKKVIDKKFYSKTDYSLRKGFLFGCLIELEEEIISDGIIQIGAESSLFELKITPYEKTQLTSHAIVSQLFMQSQKGDKVVAISDVILESSDKFHAYFSIVPFYKNFAMIEADEESFQGKSKDKNYAKFRGKTEQTRLIPIGTVSFVKNQVMPHNQTLGAYAKMGYNQFITVKN
jgi:hypothetical protein